ncbi:universal stress protein [Pigmentiphaga soli]|uniref:Universal stress protein n=1 Tax=Pigmentiphaga soli TaxID=1007095 RepID=A0ABP8HSF1_9BURK
MYQRILVALDGSDTSLRALDAAVGMAAALGAALEPLYVVAMPVLYYEVPMYDPTSIRDALLEEGAQVTAKAAELMKAKNVAGTPRVVETEGVDDVAQTIVRTAAADGADLLVLGTHGRRGFQRLMLGSVAERTVRLAACPVLLVPSREAGDEPA